MEGKTTNVDPEIEACIATVEAQVKEFNPKLSTELKIREYLNKYPTAKIMLEDTIVKAKQQDDKQGSKEDKISVKDKSEEYR